MSEKALSVSDLTRKLQQEMSVRFSDLRVEGEIADFLPHRSGHWYFTLKDPRAVISCVMFRGANQKLTWQPRVGERVLVNGGIDIYAPKGQYNLLARRMEPAGEGDLQRRIEELKRRLHAEGLFDAAHKRKLPRMPSAVGIATSPSGAALQDIRKVLGRRFPNLTIYLAPCRVQGAGAAEEIAAAIQLLNRHGKSEVLIVGRGGGSPEDLMAFNEEIVARAIYGSAIPVVSAVGHEVDFSIADMAADVRAATPSHAAELVVPERDELQARVRDLHRRLVWAARRAVDRRRERIANVRLRHPRDRIAEARLRCDDLADQLQRKAMWDLAVRRKHVGIAAGKLQALSPLAVLSRGYALALKDGQAVRRAGEVEPGDDLEIRLHEGSVRAKVQ